MALSFIITKDLINSSPSQVDIERIVSETDKIKRDYPKKFRLRDCDDITYFIGRMKNGIDEFLPLDIIGVSYGCTDIQVWENGEWVTV